MNLDGSAMTILNDVKSYNLIISEDSIYYCEESTNGFPFMRMTLDGKSKTKFFNGGANNYEGIYLANDIFYCISNGYITCYNKDGQLIANPANNIRSAFLNSESFCTNNGAVCLSDHTIYYIDYLTSPNFYKTDLAGGQKTLVKDTLGAYARNLNVIDGWIYYRVETDNNNYVLKRIRIDGTDMQYVN
jgi:hypothetical protein